LIALAKQRPGAFSFGSSGTGAASHLAAELFASLAGIEMLHVPYRGTGPALNDLMGGRIHMMFDNMPSILALSRQGKVRALAVTSEKRSPIEPELPSIAEYLPGFDVISWTCVCAPAGLPKDVTDRMSHFSKQALEHPDLVKSFRDQGAMAWYTSMAEITAFRAAQQAKLAPLIRASGAKVD
jgi:tripartite-type tricarboxylate transporter receptor subunit TctC